MWKWLGCEGLKAGAGSLQTHKASSGTRRFAPCVQRLSCVEARVGACVCTCVWRSGVTLKCCATGDIHPIIHLGFVFLVLGRRGLSLV